MIQHLQHQPVPSEEFPGVRMRLVTEKMTLVPKIIVSILVDLAEESDQYFHIRRILDLIGDLFRIYFPQFLLHRPWQK